MRVTDIGGLTAVGSTSVLITNDGDSVPAAEDNCPDAGNHGQSDKDGDGVGDGCDDTPGYPTEDIKGVFVVSEEGVPPIVDPSTPAPGGVPAPPGGSEPHARLGGISDDGGPDHGTDDHSTGGTDDHSGACDYTSAKQLGVADPVDHDTRNQRGSGRSSGIPAASTAPKTATAGQTGRAAETDTSAIPTAGATVRRAVATTGGTFTLAGIGLVALAAGVFLIRLVSRRRARA